MHDARGRELKVGDTVLLPLKVVSTTAGEDRCALCLTSVASRHDSNTYSEVTGVDGKQLLRANLGDDVTFIPVTEGNETCLKT